MDVYEQLSYLPRLAVILVSTLILVVIFGFARPDLPSANDLRADVYAGVVANNGGFWVEPGVVDPNKFTQSTANQRLRSKHDQRIPVFINATLNYTGSSQGPIYYNQDAKNYLVPLMGVREILTKAWELPVTVRTKNADVPGVLRMEAYYEE